MSEAMQWKCHDPENSERLEKLKTHGGFSDLPMLEKLVLDFEMHYHLATKFDMVVRGGMAVLLHAGDPMQRVSEDIDMLTAEPKGKIAAIINHLNTDILTGQSSSLRESPRACRPT